MTESQVTISNQLGLHMRAAGQFVKLAGRFRCRVSLMRNGTAVDGKSIVGVLTLAAAQGTVLTLRTEGDDEHEALAALKELIEAKFGESQ
ncbi:MAG: HPr family phosphocarrier protein [Candidatus Polarisedimenticolia bacterium]